MVKAKSTRRKANRSDQTQEQNSGEVVETPAVNTTEDRMTALEGMVASIAEAITSLSQKANTPVMPTVETGDAKVKAFKAAMTDGSMGRSSRVKDLLHPRAQQSGFQDNDYVTVSPDSQTHKAYLVDEYGEPIPCTKGEPVREGGEPQIGVVVNYMYTNRHGIRKYKVYFPKFSENERGDGFLETELVPCLT